jgi:hypothetical protein
VAQGDPSGHSFEIFTTSDGGNTWEQVPDENLPASVPGEYAYAAIFEVIGDNIWFQTTHNHIYHSTDRGHTWSVINGAPSSDYFAMMAADGLFLYAAYTYPHQSLGYPITTLYRSGDNGNSWEPIIDELAGRWILDIDPIPGTGTILAQFNRDYLIGPTETNISYDHGLTWLTIDNFSKIRYPEFSDASTGYAGGWQLLDDPTPSSVYRYAGSPLTGLFDPKPLNVQLEVTPNPVTDFVRIAMKAEVPGDYIMLMNDVSGRLWHRQEFSSVTEIAQQVEMSSMPPGLYTITMTNREGVITEQLMKH